MYKRAQRSAEAKS